VSHYHYHCVSSAKAFGGTPEDYAELHRWMDRSRAGTDALLHRMLAHHTTGIADGVALFGDTWTISTGAQIPTSLVLAGHVREDLGFVPTLDHYIELLRTPRWASRPAQLLFSRLDDRSV
jgi:hypothetical protein